MSEQTTSTGTAEVTLTPTTAETEPDAPKPTETVDFWKQKAREQEKRAKENSDAAKRLAELEDAQKSELQRQADATEAAKSEAVEARAEALRYRIASKHGISEDDAETFLTGTDEESLTRQAERLSALSNDTTHTSGPRPDLSQGAKGTGAGSSPEQDFARFLKTQMGQ